MPEISSFPLFDLPNSQMYNHQIYSFTSSSFSRFLSLFSIIISMNASLIFLFGSYKCDKSLHYLMKRFVWLFYIIGFLLSVNKSGHVSVTFDLCLAHRLVCLWYLFIYLYALLMLLIKKPSFLLLMTSLAIAYLYLLSCSHQKSSVITLTPTNLSLSLVRACLLSEISIKYTLCSVILWQIDT